MRRFVEDVFSVEVDFFLPPLSRLVPFKNSSSFHAFLSRTSEARLLALSLAFAPRAKARD